MVYTFRITLVPVWVTPLWSFKTLTREALTPSMTVRPGPVDRDRCLTLRKRPTFTLSIRILALVGVESIASGTLTRPPKPFPAV